METDRPMILIIVVVVAGPGQGKAGQTGPGQTKARPGTTGKPAKPKQGGRVEGRRRAVTRIF